jgi:hypothetical protein
MSKQTINIGASPNDGTGTPLRTSFDYTNQNFTEIYTALGGGVALPGATTQVIFNDGGTNLAGDAGLVYNKTTDALTVAGLVTAGSATITGAATVGTTLGVTGVSTLTGAVGVGATPIGKFDVYTTASDTNIFVRSDTTRLGQIVFKDNADAANQGIVRYDHLNDRLSFAANGAENLFLLSTGDLSVQTGNVVMATSGKGIDFSATAGTGTSELLADYEEGTFTPNIGGTATYTTQTGRYTKIGNRVHVTMRLTILLKGTGSNYEIGGLPFSAASPGAAISVGYFASLATSVDYISGYAIGSAINMTGTTAATANITNAIAVIGNATDLNMSFSYEV